MTNAKFVYYNYRKVLSYNAMWNFIVGMRGNGKTYGAKHRAIKMAIKNGDQFIYLRRYTDELKTAKETFFSDILDAFPDYDFRVTGFKAEMAKVSTRDDKKRKWTHIGYFISLSRAQSYKSVQYPKVKTIIYDEFILEKGVTHYISGEFNVFFNFYLTVDRYQDRCKVFFLANNVSITNPYYLGFDIKPDGVGEFQTYRDGYVVVHHIESGDFKNEVYKTRFGKMIADSEYAQFAVEAQFSDNHDGLLQTKTPDANYRFSVELTNGIFSVWSPTGGGVLFVQKKRPKQELIFTTEAKLMAERKKLLLKSNKIFQHLRASFNGGRMFFDEAGTRNVFLEIFKS